MHSVRCTYTYGVRRARTAFTVRIRHSPYKKGIYRTASIAQNRPHFTVHRHGIDRTRRTWLYGLVSVQKHASNIPFSERARITPNAVPKPAVANDPANAKQRPNAGVRGTAPRRRHRERDRERAKLQFPAWWIGYCSRPGSFSQRPLIRCRRKRDVREGFLQDDSTAGPTRKVFFTNTRTAQ